MPRKVRLQYPGAIYHVMSRGDQQDDIFFDDVDRQDFLKTLAEACQKTGWEIHAYCLMVGMDREGFGVATQVRAGEASDRFALAAGNDADDSADSGPGAFGHVAQRECAVACMDAEQQPDGALRPETRCQEPIMKYVMV
jgi:hypothetical protein